MSEVCESLQATRADAATKLRQLDALGAIAVFAS